MVRVVHYINQFFGGVGGEDKAGLSPYPVEGPVGPGRLLGAAMAGWGMVVGTVVCGDNYFAQDMEGASTEVERLIMAFRPGLVVAGPAFNAGRYGMACAAVCKSMRERGIQAVTGMFRENPGLEACRRDVYVIETGPSAKGMDEAVKRIAGISGRLAAGGKVGTPSEEGYFPRGLVTNVVCEKTGAERAVDLLMAKLRGEPYESEVPRPAYDRVRPAPPVKRMAAARIALVTDGGLVPKGNPDRIESISATRFGRYDIEGKDALDAADYEVSHGGYDSVFVRQDPNRLVPVDAVRELERQGEIGSLHERFYSTAGVACAVEVMSRLGEQIARELVSDGVSGVILTST